MNLAGHSVGELLALNRTILGELRARGVVRSGNAPTGDFAELLVQRATGGTLAGKAQKSWDVRTSDGARLQVKARIVRNPRLKGQRQLSPFRSWDFEAAVIVLFADDYTVWRAACIPAALLSEGARYSKHINGNLVFATDGLLDRGDDWTERLRAIEG